MKKTTAISELFLSALIPFSAYFDFQEEICLLIFGESQNLCRSWAFIHDQV